MNNNGITKDPLQILYRSAVRFLVPLSQDETYKVILAEAKKILDTKYCSIFLNIDGKLERVYASSPRLFYIQIRKNGYTQRAYRSKKPLIVSVDKTSKIHSEIVDMGIRSTIYIPLLYWKKCVGVLSADSFDYKEYSDSDLELLKFFGSLAMIAIRKSQLQDQLLESIKTRDLFISLASHELRTPLTTINSYGELIEEKALQGRVINKKWIKILRNETQRLILMVSELLQLDTIKSGKLEYNWQRKSITGVIERVLVAFRAKYPRREIIYEKKVDAEAIVYADFDKLFQAIFNVLSNAAKFSPARSKILLNLEDLKHSYQVSIRDFGKGIHKKHLSQVFEGFYKGDHSTKEGIGLGLYLAKSIIEIHRGKIDLESELGKGTQVAITIPKAK